jgi:MerR family transcriptional regulator, thiopeptide resistance regulator
MEAGDAPSTRRVKALAAEAFSLIQSFAKGDPAVLKALARLRADAPPQGLAGWDPKLTRYLDRALAALAKEKGDGNHAA